MIGRKADLERQHGVIGFYSVRQMELRFWISLDMIYPIYLNITINYTILMIS
jgi:hypothetical protein